MFKPFSPTSLLPGGHAQTVGGVYWPVGDIPYRAKQHIVQLADGDCIVLHDDLPAEWKPNDRSVLMIHGLTGCHLSSYMRRISHKLVQSNVRVFRMDLRGCGAGFELARLPYHAGRSADVAAALESITSRCPKSPTTLVGFSLGGNLTLKLLGELGKSSVGSLDSAIAVNPPIDLLACSRRLRLKSNRLYDRRFARLLWKQIQERARRLAYKAPLPPENVPRGMFEFDDQFTAPVSGFDSAEDYYEKCSGGRFVSNISIPTIVLTAADDPLVHSESWKNVRIPESVRLIITDAGGHLGYVARRGVDPDRHWMDWRIMEWVRNACYTDKK